jgi:hypothetical protein
MKVCNRDDYRETGKKPSRPLYFFGKYGDSNPEKFEEKAFDAMGGGTTHLLEACLTLRRNRETHKDGRNPRDAVNSGQTIIIGNNSTPGTIKVNGRFLQKHYHTEAEVLALMDGGGRGSVLTMVGDYAPCAWCRAKMSARLFLCRASKSSEPGPSRITYYAVTKHKLRKYRPVPVELDQTGIGGGFTWYESKLLNRNVYKAYCVSMGKTTTIKTADDEEGGRHAQLIRNLYPNMQSNYEKNPDGEAVVTTAGASEDKALPQAKRHKQKR